MGWPMAAAAAISALGSYYASKQSDGQKSKRITQLPEWLSQEGKRTAERARRGLEGDFFAGPTPEQQEGMESQLGFAQSLQGADGGQFGESAIDLGQKTLEGGFLHPDSNPYLQENIEAAQEPVVQRFQRDIMPQAMADASQVGQVGSSRQGVIESNAMNDLGRNLSDMASRMVAENYARERQMQMQAPQLLQQGTQLGMTPGQIMRQVGERKRAFEEQELQAEFLKQERMANLLGGLPSGRSQTMIQMTNPTKQGIQGALAGAQLYNLYANS